MAVKINLMPKDMGESFKWREHGSFLNFLIYVFLAISLAAFSAMFVWKTYFLEKDLLENKAKNDALNAEISEKMKSPSLVANMKASSVEKILASHLYPSKFYRLLESLTLKKVFYKEFSLDTTAKNGNIKVKIGGEADSLKVLAQQLEIFRGSKDIIGVSFDGAQMNKNGKIDFGAELSFKTSSMKFFAEVK